MNNVDKLTKFNKEVIGSAYTEIAAAPALNRDFTVQTVDGPMCEDQTVEQMIGIMREGSEDDDSLIYGTTLVIAERDQAKRADMAGRFLVSPLYRLADQELFVSPVVLFQMKFDGKMHKFMHRYDNAKADHRVEDVTRHQVLNHVLNAFTFYKINAFSDNKPW